MNRTGFSFAVLYPYPLRINTITLLWLFILPFSCFAAVITVPGDYSDIQAAINAATDGDEIMVSPGTYYGKIEFYGKNIILRSTDPTSPSVVASTVIDGNQSGSVVTFSGRESSSCVLSGFTITNGRAKQGGGINGRLTLATIRYNNIIGNTAPGSYPRGFGGGLWNCDGTIENNTISSNSADLAGGGLCSCHGTIQNNIISGNLAGVVGAGLFGGDATIQNNTISGNIASWSGGGIANWHSTIQNNVILRNFAISGCGGGLYQCYIAVQNNTIYDNYAQEEGGGLAFCYSAIQNNTIYGNIAGGSGGGLYYCTPPSPSTIMNCIIWQNTASAGAQLDECATPSYSCIQDWTSGGTGNISANPQLVDPANGDFHLQSISPCIDAGCYIDGLTQDFEGEPRGYDGTSEPRGDGSDYDIGADEYVLPRTAVMPQTWSLYK